MSSVERPSTGSRASPSASRESGVAEGELLATVDRPAVIIVSALAGSSAKARSSNEGKRAAPEKEREEGGLDYIAKLEEGPP